jgi:hypothetical protein
VQIPDKSVAANAGLIFTGDRFINLSSGAKVSLYGSRRIKKSYFVGIEKTHDTDTYNVYSH